MQAILILAHRDTEQVLRLADKLRQSFEIYIHFDTKLKLSNQEKEALKEKNIHWYQCVEVNWGGWGISAATIVLMREALKNPQITYVHILSGQDWPVADPASIYAFYENNTKLYMLCDAAKGMKKSGEPIILWQQYYFNYDKIARRTTLGKIYHRLTMAWQTLCHVNKYKKLGIDLEIYQGPNWMDLPQDAVEYLLEYFAGHENIQKLFMTGFCPDEFWVQTILYNSPYRERIVQDYHRYILWNEQHGSYPAILDESNYTDILKGDYHFMRKIDFKYSEELIRRLESKEYGI